MDLNKILSKLKIISLNPMQLAVQTAIEENDEVIVLSPTGTGKTLAFLLPLIQSLKKDIEGVQSMILVPSRELAIQIENVIRDMGTGFKTNAVYGGRSGFEDRQELRHAPAILIGTPGRVTDHLLNETISTESIKFLVLDEFDKSLEVGFENEMKEIMLSLGDLDKKVLTSATQKVKIPDFVGLTNPKRVVYEEETGKGLKIKILKSQTNMKFGVLLNLLGHLQEQNGILFCNTKENIQNLSDTLFENRVSHSIFHGSLEQIDRERSLIKFRNGSSKLLVATDLAARGIDVPELDFIIHFEVPHHEDEFIHRNGRTARMNAEGTAYIIQAPDDKMPDFVRNAEEITLKTMNPKIGSDWETLHVSGGRKDKISKGDLAGLFLKQGKLKSDQLGIIELQKECAYIAVPSARAEDLIRNLNNSKIKKRKVRITRLI